MAKKNRNALLDRLASVPVYALVEFTRLLPHRARAGLGGFIGRQIVTRNRRLRRRIEANLTYVLPELSPGERARIVGETGDNFGRTFLETLHGERFRDDDLLTPPPSGPGVEAIRAAAINGKGAVLVSGHFGQWEGSRAWMSSLGITCAGVYRRTENPYINAIYKRGLDANGTPMFEKGARGTRGLVAHLAKGNIVALLIDQYDHRAEPLDFVGRPAPTSLVAAQLALKYDVPLIPTFSHRLTDRMHIEVEVDPPIARGTAREMMQAVNDALAARIRAHPGQYYWLHRRWSKSLPAATEPGPT
ncbi:lauroyl acyltransferase [Rhodobacteraceae bacterium DSL-40]|uniref:lysophospholipid acyltransferase family protein n=1 Tax=Amaricoccus sp. B4 TaxID=3368557 RepID=UPI000DAC68F3